jgi:purine-binding chemotaxis protein CheW
MADQRQFCTFFLDRFYFGLDVLKVQEIIRYQEMTRVPLAPPEVSGLRACSKWLNRLFFS